MKTKKGNTVLILFSLTEVARARARKKIPTSYVIFLLVFHIFLLAFAVYIFGTHCYSDKSASSNQIHSANKKEQKRVRKNEDR